MSNHIVVPLPPRGNMASAFTARTARHHASLYAVEFRVYAIVYYPLHVTASPNRRKRRETSKVME